MATTQSSVNHDFPLESRPAYEIFNNLEHLILLSDSDDEDEIFMPSLDGKMTIFSYIQIYFIVLFLKRFRRVTFGNCFAVCFILYKKHFSRYALDENSK